MEASFHGFLSFKIMCIVRLVVSLTQDSTPTWSLWFFIIDQAKTPWTIHQSLPWAVEWWQKKKKLAAPLAGLRLTFKSFIFRPDVETRFLSSFQCNSIYSPIFLQRVYEIVLGTLPTRVTSIVFHCFTSGPLPVQSSKNLLYQQPQYWQANDIIGTSLAYVQLNI